MTFDQFAAQQTRSLLRLAAAPRPRRVTFELPTVRVFAITAVVPIILIGGLVYAGVHSDDDRRTPSEHSTATTAAPPKPRSVLPVDVELWRRLRHAVLNRLLAGGLHGSIDTQVAVDDVVHDSSPVPERRVVLLATPVMLQDDEAGQREHGYRYMIASSRTSPRTTSSACRR